MRSFTKLVCKLLRNVRNIEENIRNEELNNTNKEGMSVVGQAVVSGN